MSDNIEVIIGRIGRAHGVRGEVSVEVITDEPERRFAIDAVVGEESTQPGRSERRRWHVASRRWHQGRLLVGLAEVADRSIAETLRGVVLVAEVPTNESPGEQDEYYDRQLIGLRVLDHTGAEVGEVTSVMHQGPEEVTQDLLEVRLASGQHRLVPFVAALVPAIELAAGTLTVAEVAGLLDEHDDGDENA